MDIAILRNLVVEAESGPSDETAAPLRAPARAIPRTYPGAPHEGDDAIELQRLPTNPAFAPEEVVTPRTEDDDLERSRPTSPVPSPDVVEIVPSLWDPYMNRFRLLAVCLSNFSNGLSDAAAGALIPYMETHYDIGYGIVSLIFVGQALGFVVAAVFLNSLRARLGRAKLLGLGKLLMACAYVPAIAGAPFGLVASGFFFVGFGIAIDSAIGNTFCGGLQNGTFMLGLLHGGYGIGGTSGPLIATAIVTVGHAVWSRYYIITLGVTVVMLVMYVWTFWKYEKELGPAARERETLPSTSNSNNGNSNSNSKWLGVLKAFGSRVILLGSIFIFAYQGAEVSISGWVISFLINARGGDPSSVGYVSAGFWAGITLGRFCLSGPAARLGEKRFVYGLVLGAIAFQLLVWLVPNIIGEAVAVSIVGLLLGPIYPCGIVVFMRALSHRDALSSVGTISACGSLGGAVCPFVTGLLAQAVGTWVLHPIAITLFVVMLLCWYGIPSERKRTE